MSGAPVLLGGIPSEPPLALVRAALERRGGDAVVFDQRAFEASGLELSLAPDGRLDGRLHLPGRTVRLADVRGVYLRLMDDRELPELEGEPREGSRRRAACRALHDGLTRWADLADAAVVNRTPDMASNGSKPYQARRIAASGLAVPATLATNDPDAVLAFRARHGRVVYKSLSGARSIVRELRDDDLSRLERVRACPVQFQERVPGRDVRVHVVGDEVYATAVDSDADDYRYAARETGRAAALRPEALDDDLAGRCVRLAASLGLRFAGIDLRLRPDGVAVCFEANPMPAFSWYEQTTGQPIADAVARTLLA